MLINIKIHIQVTVWSSNISAMSVGVLITSPTRPHNTFPTVSKTEVDDTATFFNQKCGQSVWDSTCPCPDAVEASQSVQPQPECAAAATRHSRAVHR